jgi:hypothetical protein
MKSSPIGERTCKQLTFLKKYRKAMSEGDEGDTEGSHKKDFKNLSNTNRQVDERGCRIPKVRAKETFAHSV